MAIRLADTARPNNYVDAEHQGTFPVAYAEDIWFADGTRLSEKTFGGDSIQKEELPIASATEEGHVYQYIGTSGTYEHGCFYECIENNGVYSWKDLQVIKNPVIYTNTSPVIGAYKKDSVIIYSGEDTYGFKKGHHYKYVINESHALYLFTGEYITTHETMYLRLLESALVYGAHVYDTIGECIGYIVSINGSRVSYYSISDAEIFEIAIYGRSSIPDTISITDYLDIGEESNTVDTVANGNMKAVTSNAVYDTLNASITDLTADETVMTYEDYTVETLGAHMYQIGGLCWVHIDLRVTYTGEEVLDTDGHKDFWSNKYSIPDFDDVSEWTAIPCFGYVSNSHRGFEITLNNYGVPGGQKAIAFRLRYSENEPIYTDDEFNLRCVCCFAKA